MTPLTWPSVTLAGITGRFCSAGSFFLSMWSHQQDVWTFYVRVFQETGSENLQSLKAQLGPEMSTASSLFQQLKQPKLTSVEGDGGPSIDAMRDAKEFVTIFNLSQGCKPFPVKYIAYLWSFNVVFFCYTKVLRFYIIKYVGICFFHYGSQVLCHAQKVFFHPKLLLKNSLIYLSGIYLVFILLCTCFIYTLYTFGYNMKSEPMKYFRG